MLDIRDKRVSRCCECGAWVYDAVLCSLHTIKLKESA